MMMVMVMNMVVPAAIYPALLRSRHWATCANTLNPCEESRGNLPQVLQLVVGRVGNRTQALVPSIPVCTACADKNPPERALRRAEVVEGVGRLTSTPVTRRGVPARAGRTELLYQPLNIHTA